MAGSRVKKIAAIAIGAGLIGAGLAFASTAHAGSVANANIREILKPDDVVIVLPTKMIVNGTPVHVKNDAVAGAKLAVDIIEHNPATVKKVVEKTVIVPVRSLEVSDNDQVYTLTNSNFSELNIPDNVTVKVDFSKVKFDANHSVSVFENNAIEIDVNSKVLHLVTGNYTIFTYEENGKTILKMFDVKNDTALFRFGEEFKFMKFSINITDYSENNDELFATVKYNGVSGQFILEPRKSYVAYVENSTLIVKEVTDDLITTLKKTVPSFAVFKLDKPFIGIYGNNIDSMTVTEYDLVKKYADGDHWKGLAHWIIKVNPPVNNTIPFKILFRAGDKDNSTYRANDIDFPLFNIAIHTSIKKDSDGKVVGATYYFTQMVEKVARITLDVPKIIDPDQLIVTDTFMNKVTEEYGLPDENIVVIGGWVSNQFWEELEKYFPKEISEIKKDVMEDGYVVKFLENPVHKDKYIIIAAGRDYKETALAVEKLMAELNNS